MEKIAQPIQTIAMPLSDGTEQLSTKPVIDWRRTGHTHGVETRNRVTRGIDCTESNGMTKTTDQCADPPNTSWNPPLDGSSHHQFGAYGPPALDADDLREPCAEVLRFRPAGNTHDAHVSASGIVEAILKVGNQRKALIAQLRAALLDGSDAEALLVARRLCGLS